MQADIAVCLHFAVKQTSANSKHLENQSHLAEQFG